MRQLTDFAESRNQYLDHDIAHELAADTGGCGGIGNGLSSVAAETEGHAYGRAASVALE
jgi:hypothetical protein